MKQMLSSQFPAPSSGFLVLPLKIRSSAQRTRVRGMMADGTIKIDVAAAPEDGRANAELVRFLAEELGVGRGAIEIVSGKTAGRKVVRVEVQ